MKTSLFLRLLRKLMFWRDMDTYSMPPPCESQDGFLLIHKHTADECVARIQEAALRGKDKASTCRNLLKLDGEYINLEGCKNDRIRAERINNYLPEGKPKIKPADLAKARQNPRRHMS